MVALVTMIALMLVALYALGLVAAGPERSATDVVSSVRRGARALKDTGASWGPVEHLR